MAEHSKRATVTIVEDTPEHMEVLLEMLEQKDYDVLCFPSGEAALESVEERVPDLFLLDVRMPGMDGFELCRRLKERLSVKDVPVIFISAVKEIEGKMRAFREGGVDYVTKPFQIDEVHARIETHIRLRRYQAELERNREALTRARDELDAKVRDRTADLVKANAELGAEIKRRMLAQEALEKAYQRIEQLKQRAESDSIYLREEIKGAHNFDEIIGRSPPLKQVLSLVEQVGPLGTTVLVLGETGTGKELVARAVHHVSSRSNRPLVKVDCAALPAGLIESELFGHEKGAFTGAHARREGRFELADGGTLFLDEVAELPLDLQGKLLRVLEEGTFERVGSSRSLKVDVRIIAATNRNLEEMVRDQGFRRDLWYRLNVFPIHMPPLRDRRDDIPRLVRFFVDRFSKRVGKNITRIPPETMGAFMEYAWPGNVRELQNIIERAVIGSPASTLRPVERLENHPAHAPVSVGRRGDSLDEIEKQAILHALEENGWRVSGEQGAAKRLGLNPSTLRGRMRKHGIVKTMQSD